MENVTNGIEDYLVKVKLLTNQRDLCVRPPIGQSVLTLFRCCDGPVFSNGLMTAHCTRLLIQASVGVLRFIIIYTILIWFPIDILFAW